MTTMMLAYPNNDKATLLAQMKRHREADELVRGETWRSNGETRGCAIGCLFHKYDHSQWPKRIGGPVQLAHLVDWLFEHLPKDHLKWPERVLKAIKPGADLTNVYPQWVCRLLTRRLAELGNGEEAWRKQVREAVGNVRDLWAKGWPIESAAAAAAWSAWSAAESAASAAAWSAAESAESAASAAAESAASAAAWSAAESAESAASAAAWSAAESAESAAAAAEETQQQADDLIELLKAATEPS